MLVCVLAIICEAKQLKSSSAHTYRGTQIIAGGEAQIMPGSAPPRPIMEASSLLLQSQGSRDHVQAN